MPNAPLKVPTYNDLLVKLQEIRGENRDLKEFNRNLHKTCEDREKASQYYFADVLRVTAERDRYRASLKDALIAVRDGRLDQAEIILAAVLR